MHIPFNNTRWLALAVLLCLPGVAAALDHLTVRRDGKQFEVAGRVVITAEDGGILLMGRDGVLWSVPPDELVKHTKDQTPFRPLTTAELTKTVLAELPPGFKVYETAHYLIFYNTSKVYAQWCGSLFERLYAAFRNYWTRQGLELSDPEFPLVAVVFADKKSYVKFAEKDLGAASGSIIGYFSLLSNRMTMYDLTEMAGRGAGRGSSAQINQVLAAPDALRTVATIVHEATHQIAFNCGLHARLSDCPLWCSEGIAIYFETPDLRGKGWNGIGAVNRSRLVQFRQYLRDRPSDSLKTLLGSDKRFRDLKQSQDAYAEAWALTHFLIRQRPKQYADYLKMLAEKKPLMPDEPAVRLKEFEKIFGSLGKLDAEFLRFMARVR